LFFPKIKKKKNNIESITDSDRSNEVFNKKNEMVCLSGPLRVDEKGITYISGVLITIFCNFDDNR